MKPIAKTRPCVIVSGNVFNKLRRTIVVIPLGPPRRRQAPPCWSRCGVEGGKSWRLRIRFGQLRNYGSISVWESCRRKTWKRLRRAFEKFSNYRQLVGG
jgi:hypothetical protein